MTKNVTSIEDMITVMQGFRDGKKVQWRSRSLSGAWMPCTDPKWTWTINEYRLAPEPRELWVNIYGGLMCYYGSKEAADKADTPSMRDECIHLIEVLENAP